MANVRPCLTAALYSSIPTNADHPASCTDLASRHEAPAVVNGAARKTPATPQLTLTGRRTEATPEQALATVARQAVELLSGPDIPLLKERRNQE